MEAGNEAGAESIEVSPETGAEMIDGQPAEYDLGDYMERAGHEPEFAKKELRNKDRTITQRTERIKALEQTIEQRYKPIDPYIEAIGDVQGAIQYIERGVNYTKLEQVPGAKEWMDEVIRTGQVPARSTGQATDEDEYVDPEIKELRDQNRSLMSKLDQITQTFDQRFAQAETRSAKAGIESNLKRIVGDYGVNDDIRSELSDAITSKVGELEARANRGDQDAVRTLSGLGTDAGLQTLRMLVTPIVDTHFDTIAEARQRKKLEAARSADTGAPQRISPQPHQGMQQGAVAKSVRDILGEVTKQYGRDPDKLFAH